LRNPAVNLRSPSAGEALDDAAREELAELSEAGLRRHTRRVEGLPGARMRVDGRDVLMLAGANYLDLAGDPRVIDGAQQAAARSGAAAGGSRLISGNLDLHEALEEALARFAGKPASLLFSTGYMANLGVITALAGESDAVVSDSLNHASIIDACQLSRARTHVFRHNDPGDLDRALSECADARRRLLVLDGVYSMDGDVARLAEMVPIARAHGAIVALDDAHGFGVLGATGRGAAELAGVEPDLLIGNLGKSLGSFGAFVACSSAVRELLINTARSFIFTCGLAPAPVGAAHAALQIAEREPERRPALLAAATRLRDGLADAGYEVGGSTTHIVPVIVGDNARVMQLCEDALERGVYAQGIRFPSVPKGTARLRFTPTSGHTDADIDEVVRVFRELQGGKLRG